MRVAGRDHSIGIMLATLGAEVAVVSVDEQVVGATRNLTTAAGSVHHLAADSRRDGLARRGFPPWVGAPGRLRRRRRCAHVGRVIRRALSGDGSVSPAGFCKRRSNSHVARRLTNALTRLFFRDGVRIDAADVLCIAASGLECLAGQLDELAPCLLKSTPAARAHRYRNLVAAPPLVIRTCEHLARHQQQRLLVVDSFPCSASELAESFLHGPVHFRGKLETQDLRNQLRVDRIARTLARTVPPNHPLDLSRGAIVSGLQPFGLGLWRRHARELANDRPGKLSKLERKAKRRQLLHWPRPPATAPASAAA